jgi:hypothetical protein
MGRAAHLLTESAIDTVARAVFDAPDPWVAEAYSAYDKEPLVFSTADQLARYIRATIAEPRGLAFFFVVYPDMNGHAVRKTIHLKPESVPGHSLRYSWQGLGLISVQLSREDLTASRIAANSRARAEKWASTYPNWDAPDTWNWTAVRRHAARLQRVLRSAASQPVAAAAI